MRCTDICWRRRPPARSRFEKCAQARQLGRGRPGVQPVRPPVARKRDESGAAGITQRRPAHGVAGQRARVGRRRAGGAGVADQHGPPGSAATDGRHGGVQQAPVGLGRLATVTDRERRRRWAAGPAARIARCDRSGEGGEAGGADRRPPGHEFQHHPQALTRGQREDAVQRRPPGTAVARGDRHPQPVRPRAPGQRDGVRLGFSRAQQQCVVGHDRGLGPFLRAIGCQDRRGESRPEPLRQPDLQPPRVAGLASAPG